MKRIRFNNHRGCRRKILYTALIIFTMLVGVVGSESHSAHAAIGDLVFTIEAPGVQESQVSCLDQNDNDVLVVENFDSFGSEQSLSTYSSTIGTYDRAGTQDFLIRGADAFGGAGVAGTPATGYYITTDTGEAYELTLAQPAGYVGFWWSAGNGNNEITVNMSDGTSQTFSTQSILDSSSLQGTSGVVPGGDGHFGNPNGTDPSFDNEDEVYAFVNIFSTNASALITSIVFSEVPGGVGRFESDNHTACPEILSPDNGEPIDQVGTIIIRKQTNPSPSADVFSFVHDIPNAGNTTTFNLADGDEETFTNVPIGTYSVTEADPSTTGANGYFLNDLICEDSVLTGDASTGDLGARAATVNLESGETVTCTFTNVDNTLPVTLSWFKAERNGETVDFRWQTATETGTAGFNILAVTESGTVQLNETLIPSQVIDSVEPLDYSFTAVTDATSFLLQEVEITGVTNNHGPFALGVEVGSRIDDDEHQIWLPFVTVR